MLIFSDAVTGSMENKLNNDLKHKLFKSLTFMTELYSLNIFLWLCFPAWPLFVDCNLVISWWWLSLSGSSCASRFSIASDDLHNWKPWNSQWSKFLDQHFVSVLLESVFSSWICCPLCLYISSSMPVYSHLFNFYVASFYSHIIFITNINNILLAWLMIETIV